LRQAIRRLHDYIAPYLNQQASADSVLIWAARHGDIETACISIEMGGSLGVSGMEGTPIHIAIKHGQNKMVNFLLDRGADINSRDEYGSTPLSCAVRWGDADVLRMILNIKSVFVDSIDTHGRTALSYAAAKGRAAMVKELLKTGQVDVNSKDSKGRTPFHYAASAGHKEVVIMILAIEELTADLGDNDGRTPLSLAADAFDASRDVVDMVAELLRDDRIVANVDLEDSERRTPLFHAAARGHGKIVKLLLGTGKVDVDFQSHSHTPLSIAAAYGHEDVVKILLEAKDSGKVATLVRKAGLRGSRAKCVL
jgi:ankyrin repeat protein